MTTIAFVFARGGSKGLPGKNLRLLGGVPLVGRAVDAARRARHVDRVMVSTDDAAIAEVAKSHGADVPWLRPAELASDDAPEWRAWQHAIRAVSDADGAFDVFVSVPPTAPLRHPEDIDACVDRLAQGDCDIVVTTRAADRNPWFNMVLVDTAGHARRCIDEGPELTRRQDAPAVYDLTTVAYAARTEFVLAAGGMFDGIVATVEIPRWRAIDIDDDLDFEIVSCLFERSTEAEG